MSSCVVLSPGQTIATCQRNIPQHFWAQHVVFVWPPCCDVLRPVGCCWLKLKMVKFGPTTPNTSQHVATGWPNARNMLRPTMLRYVALACCDHLAGALELIALNGEKFQATLTKQGLVLLSSQFVLVGKSALRVLSRVLS